MSEAATGARGDGRATLVALLALCAAGLVLALPSLIHGFPVFGYDSRSHLVRYAHFAAQLWAGEPYPRWLAGMNLGLGDPSMFFYPPVAYYLASVLRPLFGSDPLGFHQLAVAALMASVASGAALYLWLGRLLERRAALAAALLYMALPYHLAADLYLRGALAEYWAFVWMPLVLWLVDGVGRWRGLAAVGLALAWGLLVMTHPPTTLAFAPVVLGYALAVAGAGGWLRGGLRVAGAMVLGFGLAAVYLLPLMENRWQAHLQDMPWAAADYFESRFLFRFPSPSPNPTGDLVLSAAVGATAALAGLAAVVCRLRRRLPPGAWFWAAVAAASLVMTTPLSKPLWLLLPALRRLNFPWRFATVLTVATAALAAYALASLSRPLTGRLRAALGVAAALVAAGLVLTAALAFTTTKADHAEPDLVALGIGPKVFWPRVAFAQRPEVRERLLAESWGLPFGFEPPYLARFGAAAPRAEVVRGEARLEVRRWAPRDIALTLDAATPVAVVVGQFLYPGWRARIVGEACCLPLRPSHPDGLIELRLAPGDHQVELRLGRQRGERLGALVSALSLLVTAALAALALWSGVRARRGGGLGRGRQGP